ncbi:MAG: DUF1826 domain-containing protein [Pseudomonadota bacterium]
MAINVDLAPTNRRRRASPIPERVWVEGNTAGAFGDIYRDDVNLVVWKRDLPESVRRDVDWLLDTQPGLAIAETVAPTGVREALDGVFTESSVSAFCDDVTSLVNKFCFLFDLQRVGMRLAEVTTAMCPKFHVDRVPCRLITSYRSTGTEWLPHGSVDRSSLGSRQRSVAFDAQAIRHLQCGDVGLLKGEEWIGNANGGLVHRSPTLRAGEKRLLLTLDFAR